MHFSLRITPYLLLQRVNQMNNAESAHGHNDLLRQNKGEVVKGRAVYYRAGVAKKRIIVGTSTFEPIGNECKYQGGAPHNRRFNGVDCVSVSNKHAAFRPNDGKPEVHETNDAPRHARREAKILNYCYETYQNYCPTFRLNSYCE